MDVGVNSSLSKVVELIISQYDWFFQNDATLSTWDELLTPVLHTLPVPVSQPGDTVLANISPPRHNSVSSPMPSTR